MHDVIPTPEQLFDQSKRRENGVKARLDGNGDPWGNAHREGLGNTFHMLDFDAYIGTLAFGQNTADQLFTEFVPDDYKNRGEVIRNFGLCAMFDRKADKKLMYRNPVALGWQLKNCRLHAAAQGVAPKFFFVVGGDRPPWEMIEVNIRSGEIYEKPAYQIGGNDWSYAWHALGLTQLRQEIAKRIRLEDGFMP